MASREFWKVQGGDPEMKILTGNFTITTNGEVDVSDSNDFALALSGTGEYTATLNDSYQKLLFADMKVLDATNHDRQTLKSEAVSNSTPTVIFNSWQDDGTSGVPALTDLTSGDKVFVMIIVKNVAD